MKPIRRRLLLDGALLVVALTSGLSVLLARRCDLPAASSDTSTLLLPSLSGDPPHALSVTRDGVTVRVVNQSTTSNSPVWYADSPWNRTGDLATVDSMVTALRDLQVVRRLDLGPETASTNLVTLGLDRPQSTWQIESDDAHCTLKVGASAPPPRGGTYVEVIDSNSNSRRFFVVSGDISRLTLSPERLLESRLLPYVPSDICLVKVDSEHNLGAYQFDTTRSRWFEATGLHRRISREKIEKLLLTLTNLKGEHFSSGHDNMGSKTGTAIATVNLVLEKTHADVVVQLYPTCGKWPELTTIRVSGATSVVACANAQDLKNLLVDEPATWLDDHLFSIRADEIEGVSVKLDGRSLVLERQEMGFWMSSPESRRIDIDSGNDALQTLISIRGDLVNTEPKNAQTDVGAGNYIEVRSAVVGATDRYEERVLIGPEQANGQRWAKRATDSTLLRLDAKAVRSLNIETKLLAPPPISAIPPK